MTDIDRRVHNLHFLAQENKDILPPSLVPPSLAALPDDPINLAAHINIAKSEETRTRTNELVKEITDQISPGAGLVSLCIRNHFMPRV